MVTWELLSSTMKGAAWDDALLQSHNYNVFQSFSWGEYKRASGWTPMRWIARSDTDGVIAAMAQILTKRFPVKTNIGWSPGGPVLRFAASAHLDAGSTLNQLLKKIAVLSGRTCIRFDCYLPRDATLVKAFGLSCAKPLRKINTGYTLCLDLSQSTDALMRQIKPNHRACVKKGLTENIEWKIGNDVHDVSALVNLHAEMIEQKKLSLSSATTNDVNHLCQTLNSQAMIFTGYVGDEAITSYLILIFGRKAFYLMGATGEKGRRLKASYPLVIKIIEQLQKQGITEFDFGGLDPQSRAAAGVNHFKKGFGGEVVEHLGEWEWANSESLRIALNLALWYRGRQL